MVDIYLLAVPLPDSPLDCKLLKAKEALSPSGVSTHGPVWGPSTSVVPESAAGPPQGTTAILGIQTQSEKLVLKESH